MQGSNNRKHGRTYDLTSNPAIGGQIVEKKRKLRPDS